MLPSVLSLLLRRFAISLHSERGGSDDTIYGRTSMMPGVLRGVHSLDSYVRTNCMCTPWGGHGEGHMKTTVPSRRIPPGWNSRGGGNGACKLISDKGLTLTVLGEQKRLPCSAIIRSFGVCYAATHHDQGAIKMSLAGTVFQTRFERHRLVGCDVFMGPCQASIITVPVSALTRELSGFAERRICDCKFAYIPRLFHKAASATCHGALLAFSVAPASCIIGSTALRSPEVCSLSLRSLTQAPHILYCAVI